MLDVRRFRKKQADAAARQKKSGPRTPWQAYKFAMDVGDEAAIQFKPMEPFLWEYHGFNPNHTCTSNEDVWPEFKGKCVWCYYCDRDKAFRDKWYQRSSFVMSLLDFRFFHWEMGQKNGRDVVLVHVCQDPNPTPGRRNRCPHCNSTDEFVRERRFGGLKRWELNKTQFNQVTDAYARLQQICVHVDAEGNVCNHRVFDVAYNCAHCGHEVLDERALQSEDAAEVINNPYQCSNCGNEDFLKPLNICDSDAHEPVPGSLFDKMLTVTCSGTSKEVGGKMRTLKNFNFEVKAWPWRSAKDNLGDFAISDEDIQKMLEEEDVRSRYSPAWGVKRADFETDDEWVDAVLKKQAENAKKPLPPEYADEANGRQVSTGSRAWSRTR